MSMAHVVAGLTPSQWRSTAPVMTRRWCPTTPAATSRSSTSRICGRSRCCWPNAWRSGTDALLLGYPGGGDFVATPVRIREVVELNGPDIYRTTTVTREVYTIRGAVRQGASGGPLI